MGLVEAKCTNCGATLSVDGNKDAMICPYCGSAFVVEKAIQNFNNTYNVTNNIAADTVIVKNNPNDSEFVIEYDKLKKYQGHSSVVKIPEGTYSIGYHAFGGSLIAPANNNITTVILPDSLKRIEFEAFSYCENLESIKNTSNVEFVGRKAFLNTKIQELDLSNCLEVEDGSFEKMSSLKELRINKKLIATRNPGAISGLITSPFVDEGNSYKATQEGLVTCPVRKVYIDGILMNNDDPIFSDDFFAGTQMYKECLFKQKERKENKWIKDGRCKYCGGELRGLFTKTCKKCGRRQN